MQTVVKQKYTQDVLEFEQNLYDSLHIFKIKADANLTIASSGSVYVRNSVSLELSSPLPALFFMDDANNCGSCR